MKKRFIIVPITALATLGLSSSVVLANNKVSLINDKVYIEEGADLDVDWDALRKASGNNNDRVLENTMEPTSTPEPTAELDIKFTLPGQLFAYQGDILTEEVLKLPSDLHLVDAPYVCEQTGSYYIHPIVINDNNEYGSLDYNVVVYERPATPAPTLTSTPTPTVTPTTAPSPTPTSSATGNNNSGSSVVSDIDDYNQSSGEGDAIEASNFTKGTKTVTIACGSVLRFDDLGFNDIHLLDTNGNSCSYSYDYDESCFDKKYSKVQTFETIVTQTNDTTGEVVKYTVTVTVKDMTKPNLKGVKKVIKIVGGKDVVARIKEGVSATDNVDGKIAKSRIKVSGYKAKKYDKVQKVTFTVKDKAGNITKKTVKLKIINPVEKVNKTMYTKSVVNVRKTSSAKGKKLGTLKFGTKVKVIGQDRNTGWYKIKYKGGTGWVSDSHLSRMKLSKPIPNKSSTSKTDSKSDSYDCMDDGADCFCIDDCHSWGGPVGW